MHPRRHQVLLQRAQLRRHVLAGCLLRLAQLLLQLGVLVAHLQPGDGMHRWVSEVGQPLGS